jgi:cation diffusion facilitator CzcD-associated flavoprotein CzcO
VPWVAIPIAPGCNAVPRLPDWPGLADYSGTWLHASDYRSGRDLAGRDVLVVGTGDTGAEIAVDLVEQVRQGHIEPVAAVGRCDERSMHLVDGKRLEVDVLIAATGYPTGLERLVGHLGVLDERGRPDVPPGRSHPRAPRLYFVGLRNPLTGLLHSVRLDAARIARSPAADLAARTTAPGRRRSGA